MSYLEPFPEKKYQEILKEVGPFRYQIYDKGEILPGNVFSPNLPFTPYHSVLAGTA